MKEKTKKILKGAGLALGSIALLALGVGIGACSVKNGSTQPITTTPIKKGLNQRPKKAPQNYTEAHNYLDDSVYVNANLKVVEEGNFKFLANDGYYSYCFTPSTLPSGYYYVGAEDESSYRGGSIFYCDDYAYSALEMAQLQTYPITVTAEHFNLIVTPDPQAFRNSYIYINWPSGMTHFVLNFGGFLKPYLYLVDTLDLPAEDILELPNNWSPLRMVAKNVNKENNLIFDTDWNNWVDVPFANGQPMLDLSTMLFKNQGRVYNHIYIYFKNLNGLKYATNSENIGTGTSSDWCADRVEYAFIVDNSLKYNYLASSVGTSILKGESVFNLGLNWSNSLARKLEIIDKHYPNDLAIANTALKRFPRTPSSSLDPITNEIIRPFGYLVWDYEYLVEYSNVTSVDFILGGSSDVFGIFTNAFNSVIPLLSVQVLPSISLGILLFLPLIGGIIVVIIRVIKK